MLEAKYNVYADRVIKGEQVACEWIILACKRYKEWQKRDDIEFRCDKADRAVKFIESLRHYAGKSAGKRFILEEWQKFVVYNIFGWYYKGTNKRVTKKVLIFCARKVGKTMFGAAIALYLLIGDGVPGSQILNVANSRQQAYLLFTMEQELAKSLDPRHKYTKVTRDKILYSRNKSYAQVLSSDASGLDGYGGHFICDEVHEYRDSKLWDVLISGQGYIESPLAIQITTAGFRLDGFLYQYTQICKDVLKGLKQDDTQFSMIFTLDEDDDWRDEACWVKANPNIGVTVSIEYLREQVTNAINNPALEVGVKTKNMNMFCQSKDVWIPDNYIRDCSEVVDIIDFKDEICYWGVDLSAVSDLTCYSIMFPPNSNRELYPDKYVFKTFAFIPESTYEESLNAETYKQWVREGYAFITSGNVVDYDEILKHQLNISKDLYVHKVALDRWNAASYQINAENEGLPIEQYSQSLSNFNAPTKQLEILIRSHQVVIDNNPLVRWAFQNVEIKSDWSDNQKPVKSGGDSSRKIDPVISMIQALGIYLYYNNSAENTIEVFEGIK